MLEFLEGRGKGYNFVGPLAVFMDFDWESDWSDEVAYLTLEISTAVQAGL